MITKPPGIEDIFPDRMDRWNFIAGTARDVFRTFNYREIIIPVFEYTELFARGLGDETDIVTKEMFSFEDRGGRNLTLRPEGTASVVRAYIENGEYNRLSNCKLFYIGPMFRAERPQKGRLRQFNQFGAEIFGSANPFHDYEIIAMMDAVAKRLGIREYGLLLNSIGCPGCRKGYIGELVKYYGANMDKLCEDCRRRLEKNPFRLLDCKVEGCVALKKGAPLLSAFLCSDCRTHHDLVKDNLDRDGIVYTEDPCLVRGLDYYNRTTFEFVTGRLGGQNAFAAGGRYDSLVETLGGKPTPAVGFAAGMERIFLLLENDALPQAGIDAYIIHSGGDALESAKKLAARLRSQGLSVDIDPSGAGFKSQFKKADRERARFAVIIGEEELAAGVLAVKDMAGGEQSRISADGIVAFLNASRGK